MFASDTSTIAFALAFAALTLMAWVDVKIRTRQWVSARAVGLARVVCTRTFSPQDVVAQAHRFKMIGIHAVPHTAQVIERLGCDRTDKQFVNDAMSFLVATVPPRHRISCRIARCGPQPTARCVDENLGADPFRKAREGRIVFWSGSHSTNRSGDRHESAGRRCFFLGRKP